MRRTPDATQEDQSLFPHLRPVTDTGPPHHNVDSVFKLFVSHHNVNPVPDVWFLTMSFNIDLVQTS